MIVFLGMLVGALIAYCVASAITFVSKIEEKQKAEFDATKPEGGIDMGYFQRNGKKCPAHSWQWHDQPGYDDGTGYLMCKDCKKTPTMISEEHNR